MTRNEFKNVLSVADREPTIEAPDVYAHATRVLGYWMRRAEQAEKRLDTVRGKFDEIHAMIERIAREDVE